MKKKPVVDVKIITQEEFDKIPESQRPFYQDLIDSGKMSVKIPERIPRSPYHDLMNIPVVITFLDGSQLNAVLTDAWTYEFGLIRHGHFILVLKHAVQRIEQI